jgi:hypothetical protein
MEKILGQLLQEAQMVSAKQPHNTLQNLAST